MQSSVEEVSVLKYFTEQEEKKPQPNTQTQGDQKHCEDDGPREGWLAWTTTRTVIKRVSTQHSAH